MGRWLFFGVLVAVSAGPCWSAPNEMARDDWYFRESLVAIRHWEETLARWEKGLPEAGPPRFPVPQDGQPVIWPNPIPCRLVPKKDRGLSVHLRATGSKIEVQRLWGPGRTEHQSVSSGGEVLGYKHPGGGGKDQWYHAYSRRFDRLTMFRPQQAPFALLAEPFADFGRGQNELVVTLRSAIDRPLEMAVQLDFCSGAQSRACGRETLSLSPGGRKTVRLPVQLDAEGGGLLVLTVTAGGSSYWLTWFTHVEQVSSVLESVGQILADEPNAEAGARLSDLRQQAAKWHSLIAHGSGVAAGPGPSPSEAKKEASEPAPGASAAEWSALFEQASALRDQLLLGRLRFDTLLFVKRKPFFSEQPFMDAHHLYNRPGGAIYRLQPPSPAGKVTPVVDRLGEGVYRDMCLHWDAKRLLFAFGNGSDSWDGAQSYHVYEVNVDGSGLRQLTFGPKNDCEPFYLPDGRIGFTSDRSEHFVMCGGDRHSPNLYAMNSDGSNVQRLSFNVFNDFTPAVLPDGRIIYGRWEYNERSVTSLHNPFTMNPDGTMVAPYYGNATIRPNVVMFPRPVPGSRKVMALFTAHHGQTHGSVGLIDVRRGVDGPAAIELLTPQVPVTGEKAEDSRYGWFSDPVPLSESTWLCSYTPTVVPWLEWTWAIYVADRHGNLALVYRDPEISCAEPVPLIPRPHPHVIPCSSQATDAQDAEAALVLIDVYVGLPEVPRGTVRYLRILEDVPRVGVHRGGVVCTAGTSIFTIKRVLGTVPVEEDGSAFFVVPANRNVYFEVLDARQREIQRMRSVVCLRPGELRSCIGCHESRHATPPGRMASAVRRAVARPPSRPEPPPWGTQIISFLRDVQPVLNAQCIACHTHDRQANRVILTDDLTDRFTIGYEELLPYLSVASAMRWDHPEDVYPRAPYTYGSNASRLVQILDKGHHGVRLSEDQWQRLINWIDANGVYYDTYETAYWPNRRIFSGAEGKAIEQAAGRRCASCHGHGDGRMDTWLVSLNRRDVRLSRALMAPLSRAAGGWGRCDGTVFASTQDPDYQIILNALISLRNQLAQHPREDLVSIRGTPAESQPVVLPGPPPPGKRELPEGDWVFLSDLTWETGRAGWSPNRDGLPRRDKDIENNPLQIGARRYRKGIGTHAPSEITYPVNGRYSRFFSVVGAAERGGTVVFQVFGDDRCLFDSGPMHGLQSTKTVDVSLSGVRILRLVVTDAGDGITCDMANWADARLLRAPAPGKQQ